MKRRKLALTYEEEDGLVPRQGNSEAFDDDEEDDNEDLDQFETDGFLVFDNEEDDELESDQGGKGKQHKEKKRKMRSLKDLVLDEDDIELIQENKTSGLCLFPNEREKFKRLKKTASRSTKVVEQSNVSDDEGLLFDDILGDEDTADDNKEDEMANFVVNDGEPYGQRSLLRYFEVNQKKFEQVVTICSSALNDAGPIIGDASKILNQQKQKEVLAMEVKPEDSIEFEPYFLADKYITERNNHVRDTDVPERMQMIEEIVGALPLGQLSREEESVWILNQLVFNTYLLFCKKRTPQISEEGSIVLNKIKKTDIMKFLELHHVDKFDVPFISMYRKEQCRSLLDNIEQDEAEDEHNNDVGRAWQLKWHKVLWVIKELDRKWLLLQKRKSAIRMYQRKHYDEESLNIEDSDRFTFYEKMFESISKSLENAESEEEIDDVDAKFRLHFPSVDGGVDGKFKRPIKKSLYTNCMKADLWKVANQFGCNSEQLSLQIAFERTVGEFQEHPDRPPEEIASDFTCAMFETPELVLKGARHMAAIEIGSEPGIKKHIRSIFMDKAVVSTSPTPEGNLTIDCSHQFFGVKWLLDKPVSKFNDAQWLFIQKAEEGKLLQVSIKLPESTLNEVMNSFNDAYIIAGAGRSAQLWKEQCKLILNNAFFNFILPDMEKEARKLLTFRAKHWLLMDYGKELWKMVSVGPYLYNDNSIDSMETFSAKVMSCCWGPGKPPTTFVMLDSSGELLDVLETGAFILRSQTIDAQQRKKHDQQRVLKFIKIHQPHVIVIGAGNPSCVRLKDDVKEIVSKMEENLGDLGQAINGISVIYGDESLPQLYEVSQISSDQLPGQPGIVKRAVALGRYLQNPLAMIATLCGAGREIISWKLSPLDHFLTPDEKYEMIEQVMVDVTNQVGFDINFAVNHDWYLPLLQFISGLGPQKAAVLQRELSGNGAINNRRELASFGIKTKKVFHNAVGFLSVRCRQLSCSSFDINLLDDTRIHPESYELAERLANAVCKDVTEAPIGYVKKEPQVLSTFDINDFSDNYEIEEGENRRETFDHIKTELLHGFRDPRKPYKVPSLDEEFNLICGKNGTALAEGRLTQAIVRHVLSKRAFCVLDSGLTGIISKEDFSDEVHEDDSFSLEAKLHEGDKVSCKIKQIDKSRCQVLLTCKESEMKTSTLEDICEVDPYYHKGWSILLKQAEKAVMDENLVMKHFKPRIISHPCFTNMTMDEAKEFLSDKDVGESIFCPSPRGPSYLTLTLKVFDELYVNKEIIEGGKDHNDITSFLHLGKTLKIGDDTFGDLDEVMDQYVVPLVKHLKEMLGFRKFRRGSKAEIDEALRAEKSEYPLRIVYSFGVSHEHPGTFILSYIRNVNLHHEYVGLLPSGFRFRKRTFKKIEHLVAFFQKNIDDLQHKSLTLENPGLRNSSSLYTGGGWQDQLNSSNDRSVPGGSNNDYHRDESGLKKHLSALPSPPNGPGSGLSSGATNWGSCSKDLPGGWGSGADTSGGKWNSGDGRGSGSTGGWGSTKNGDDDGDENNGVWLTGRDNVSGCGRGGARGHGRGVGCSSGWDGNKEDDNGGSFGTNEGVWHSGRNNRGRCNGGRSSGWGGAKEDKSHGSFGLNGGVWHASESNSGGRGRSGGGRGCGPGRGFGGGGSWGSTKEGGSDGGFGGDEEAWHATGNDFHGVGHGGGEHDGPGRGRGGRGGSWNNDRGDYGPGRGRGGSGGSWNSDRGDYGPGRGRGGRGGNWNNDRGDYGPGRGRCGRDGNWNSDRGNDGPGHGRGGRVGSWNSDRGDDGPGNGRGGRGSSWSSDRGGRRGSGSSWRGSGRGRCCSNNGGDNSHRGSEFGGNSSSWGCNTSSWGCNNEDRKWNHDKETNFHNGSTSGNWGSNNVNSDRDNNGMTGNSSGGSWNANAEAFVGGSSWKPREGIGSGVNGAGRSWDNTNNNSRGILGSRPDNWGGNVGGNQGGWSSGWQGANVMNKDSETPNTSRDGPGNKWGESSKDGW